MTKTPSSLASIKAELPAATIPPHTRLRHLGRSCSTSEESYFPRNRFPQILRKLCLFPSLVNLHHGLEHQATHDRVRGAPPDGRTVRPRRRSPRRRRSHRQVVGENGVLRCEGAWVKVRAGVVAEAVGWVERGDGAVRAAGVVAGSGCRRWSEDGGGVVGGRLVGHVGCGGGGVDVAGALGGDGQRHRREVSSLPNLAFLALLCHS